MALQEEERLRTYFGKNLYNWNRFETLNVILGFYRSVAKQVPSEAVPSVVNNLFPYLNSTNNPEVIDHAVDALDCYVPLMSEEQVLKLNTHYLALLEHSDPRVLRSVLGGYYQLIDRLPKQQADISPKTNSKPYFFMEF